jgi:Transposase, Mutator family
VSLERIGLAANGLFSLRRTALGRASRRPVATLWQHYGAVFRAVEDRELAPAANAFEPTGRHDPRCCQRRKRIRTTNLLERTFAEVRRRAEAIGRFPGETSALSLIWAVLELCGWRGVKMTPEVVAEIESLRRELRTTAAQPPTTSAQEVIAA